MRPPAILLLLVLLLGASRPAAADPETFKEQLEAYKQAFKGASFFERMWAARALARTKEEKALDVIVKDYGRFPEPRDQSQYLAASLAARAFDAPAFVPALARWRARNARPEHAWLWFQTLLVQARHAGAAELVEVATGRQHPYLRAAALAALVELGSPELLQVVPAVLTSLPKDEAQRTALLDVAAASVPALAHEEGAAGWHGLARQLADQLDDPLTSAASKVVVARHLQRAFDVPYAFTEAAPWRQVLASVQALMEIPSLSGAQVGEVRLGPVRARGNRIAYVLDLSEGGTREAAPWDLQALAGEPGGAGEAAPADGGTLRVLALRQALQRSLEALSPEQSFAVICCRHSDSDLAPGCTGMMPAIPRNVEDVMAGLVKVAPRHESDLHAGLQCAFSVVNKGLAKKQEYVDKAALLEGCDTVFLLAHSAPTRDAWVAAGDAAERPRMTVEGREVRGVYADPAWLAEELKRWNLLRRAEIHAIGIGDAPKEEFQELFLPYRGWGTLGGTEARRADDDAAGSQYEAIQRAYDAYLKRPSLFMRMRGRRRLARTGDPRALDTLARSYARTEAPTDRVPHLLASLCADTFGKPEHLARFHAWREKHAGDADAWLWYRTALLDLEHGAAADADRLAREAPRPYLRLAAARALAARRKPECVGLAGDLLASLPDGGLERALQVEAAAALLEARGHMRTASDFAAPCEALIVTLRDGQLPLRTRGVVARHLARIFKTDAHHGLDADRWLRELRGAQAAGAPEPPAPKDVYAPFEFIGIPSAGGRVCYVIDASDSMLEPVTDEERKKLSRVVTGPGASADEQDALPWDRIKNRFDVAREYLKLSLRRLTEDKAFSIVLFGTDAERLPSTPGLVRATSAAVRAAIRDLDAIQPGPATPERPRGTLRGFTNMHGGLSLAFRLTSEKLAGPDPYVDPTMLLEGVDTVFLLSDGDPSTDDYRMVDRPDAGDTQADPETRAKQEKVPDVTYYGPYVEHDDYLVDDVRRMNLFRNAAIHCVGIGEANMPLLRLLAECGLGETKQLGRE